VSQVFLSYHHVQPDEQLAKKLCAFLQERGLRVFIDSQIRPGSRWSEEIDQQLRASDAFVVFLSKASIDSDMLRKEVMIAYKIFKAGQMTIFPVRIGFQEELPFTLGGWLDGLQHINWHQSDSEEEFFAQLHGNITGQAYPPPAAYPRIIQETGTMRPDSLFYIRRHEDEIAERRLEQPGSMIVVQGPLQSGKSSLLIRLHARSRHKGYRTIYLDFQTGFDKRQLSSLHNIFQAIAHRMALLFKTSLKPDDVWDSKHLGEKGSFENFLARAVLANSSLPAVIILDELDRLFERSYSNDFFGAILGWHKKQATEGSDWEKLHIALGHAINPTLWLDPSQSPFSIGKSLLLSDFTHDQVAKLNGHLGSPLNDPKEIEFLIDLLGGHPYLVHQALHALATEHWSLDQLDADACKDNGLFGDHLRLYLSILFRNETLRTGFARILRGEGCDGEGTFQQLWALGLVAGEDRSSARPRCGLYKRYFLRHL